MLLVSGLIGSLTDPLSLIVFGLAGVVVKRYAALLKAELILGLLAAAAVSLANYDFWSRVSASPELLVLEAFVFRPIAALVIGTLVWGPSRLIARAIARHTAARPR